MIQIEYPRDIHTWLSFSFGVHYVVPFSLHAGKGRCCMWAVNKVEIYIAKIGFVDSKWSNVNASRLYTLGSTIVLSALISGCRKREMLHVDCYKIGN